MQINERLVSVALLIPAPGPGLGEPKRRETPLLIPPRVHDLCEAGGQKIGRENVARGVSRERSLRECPTLPVSLASSPRRFDPASPLAILDRDRCQDSIPEAIPFSSEAGTWH